MRRIRTHRLGVDQGTAILFSDFEHGGEMWSGEGQREIRKSIVFSESFADLPAVFVTMSMWDLDKTYNQRVDIAAEAVTRGGFEIVFRTWGDTSVARVRADWIAYGEVSDQDDWIVD